MTPEDMDYVKIESFDVSFGVFSASFGPVTLNFMPNHKSQKEGRDGVPLQLSFSFFGLFLSACLLRVLAVERG